METANEFHFFSWIAMSLALLFAFSNGFRDSSTIVATVVSTRVLTPTVAFILCSLCEFSGAMFLGSAVVRTIGRGLMESHGGFSQEHVLLVLGTALSAAVLWGVISWWRAWPISNNHALFAGIAGASWAAWGTRPFKDQTFGIVFLVLISSPFLGFLLSALLTASLRYAGEWMTLRARPIMDRMHVLACLLVSCAHGANDGQMVMGVLALALGLLPHVGEAAPNGRLIPTGIRLAVAFAMAAGVLLGGRRILRKLGMKFYRIRSLQGMGAEITSAGMLLTCAWAGFPASTTQVITGSIIGAGASKNPRAVRWPLAQEVVLSWFLTLPMVGLVAFLFCRAYLSMGGCG